MELIQHEIEVIRLYNRLTRYVAKNERTNTFKKSRNKKAIELNLLRKLKNKQTKG